MQSFSKYFGATLALFFVVFQVFGIGLVIAETFPEEGILDCSPNNQTIEVGEAASFSVTAISDEDGRFYVWHAPGGTPNSAQGQALKEFETTYSQAGEYTVTVFSMEFGNDASNCSVTVENPPTENTSTVKVCKKDDSGVLLSGWSVRLTDGLEGSEGDYSGITGVNGCATFEGVPYGAHEVWETMQDGWNYISGQGDVVVDEPTETFFIVNQRADEPVEQVDICHATASHTNPYISESPDENGDVSGHDGHNGPIWFEGIDEEWGDIIPPFFYDNGNEFYPGQNWTAEGQAVYENDCVMPDGDNGDTATVTLEKVAEDLGTNEFGTHVKYTITWRVEGGNVSDLVITDVLPDWTDGNVASITPASSPVLSAGQLNYIDPTLNPTNNRTITWDFDGELEGATGTVSFELETWNNEICSVTNTATATWKYGNNLTGSVSDTSNTINVPDNHCNPPTPPQCSDDVDNSDPEDTLVDEADPGCHSDGDANNSNSYVPTDNDETNSPGGGGDDNECEDNVDNADPEDTLVDENDPGCHTDNDATDGDNTYDPNDDNETDPDGGGGGGDDNQCEDDVDNNDPEDTLVDENDPGCHTDGAATDGDDTYNPNDDDETDDGGTGGGETECADGIDNDDPEDTLIDSDDPGCHTDGDATDDDDTYNPDDDDETDEDEDNGGGGGGGGGGSSSGSSGSRRSSGSSSNNNAGQVLGAETSCGIHVDKYLRVGHANDPETVEKVQNFLNFYLEKNLVVDGVYGRATEAAVREFQVLHLDNVLDPWGIAESTGIFYLTTQTEVNNILCPELNLPIPDQLINWSQNPHVVLPPSLIA